jgi:hypothetical protein
VVAAALVRRSGGSRSSSLAVNNLNRRTQSAVAEIACKKLPYSGARERWREPLVLAEVASRSSCSVRQMSNVSIRPVGATSA